MSRSTLCNLFHQTAQATSPLWQRLRELVPEYALVLADETPIPVLEPPKDKTHKGYIWTFITVDFICYRYSRTRSGETPIAMLKDSTVTLLVDGYSGYNAVCTPQNRTRTGCFSHVRRKFFDAKSQSNDLAEQSLDMISRLYQIEYQAAELGILHTAQHLALRQERSSIVITELHSWLKEHEGSELPQSAIGRAIAYTLNNWEALTQFLIDPKIPLDNNRSERALRIVALGRKNYLFAGSDEAAENLAGLYSLVATCELHGISPEEYLADVLIRVHTHPSKNLDELLPHKWRKPEVQVKSD